MSRIKSKGSKIETTIFAVLRKDGFYFQKHYGRMPGKPDLAVPSKKIAVFIHSDFWHGWRFSKWKNDLPEYWKIKIERNRQRDRRNSTKLKKMGWKVLNIWEHQLHSNKEETISKIEFFLKENA